MTRAALLALLLCASSGSLASSNGLIVKANEDARGNPESVARGASFTLLNAGPNHLTGLSASLAGASRAGAARFEHDCPRALPPRARCVIRARWAQGQAPRGARLLVSYNEGADGVGLSLLGEER